MKALKMHTQKRGCFQTSLFSFFLSCKFFTALSIVARCVFEAKRQREIGSIRWMKQEAEGQLISEAGWCFILGVCGEMMGRSEESSWKESHKKQFLNFSLTWQLLHSV